MKLIIKGKPITKKNSQRIITKPFPRIIQSKAYIDYEKLAIMQIKANQRLEIENKINLKCIYYMPTKHRVDLTNLLNATCDILVKAKVIKDDNANIVASHDGSRVLFDKLDPRVEIEIQELGG